MQNMHYIVMPDGCQSQVTTVKKCQAQRSYLSNLYPCKRVSARIVFVEVAKQPNKAAQNPNMLKLSSVTDVRRIPPTIGTREAQIRQSKYFLHTSHCKTTVYVHQRLDEVVLNNHDTKQVINEGNASKPQPYLWLQV